MYLDRVTSPDGVTSVSDFSFYEPQEPVVLRNESQTSGHRRSKSRESQENRGSKGSRLSRSRDSMLDEQISTCSSSHSPSLIDYDYHHSHQHQHQRENFESSAFRPIKPCQYVDNDDIVHGYGSSYGSIKRNGYDMSRPESQVKLFFFIEAFDIHFITLDIRLNY